MNVLAIVAHPDDEVLGCGGALAKMTGEGHDVSILILGEGATSRYDDRCSAPQDSTQELQRQSAAAAKALGIREPYHLGLADNRFDTVPLLDVIKRVEGVIREVKPELVITHHGGDLNIDHRITFQAVLTAVRPQPASSVRDLWAFEVLSSTEWAFGQLGKVFTPTLFLDISSTMSRKLAAMAEYPSEKRDYPHPRSDQAIRALASYRGCQSGCALAEAYEQVFSLR